jgi:hypothetical protein
MAFTIITGLMGGGKSYLGVETCLQAAKEGAIVHTNLPLVQEEWEKLDLWKQIVILPREPSLWIRHEKKIVDGVETEIPTSDCIIGGSEGRENLVIFDEASIVFRTKDQAKNKDRHQPVFDLIALSRHVGLEIIFLAQHEDNISADLRRLAQHKTKCIATKTIPLIGWIVEPWFGAFVRDVYRGLQKAPYMRSYHKFSPVIGALYKTHGMAESVSMRVEATRSTKAMDGQKKKSLLLFVGAPLLCILIFGAAIYRIKTTILNDDESAKAVAPADQVAAPQAAAPSGPTDPVAKIGGSNKGGWRLKEWDLEDEHILGSVIRTSQGITVYARGGWRLSVGSDYMGEPLIEHVVYAGWHYFQTVWGRVVVVRPIRPQERESLPPLTIQGQVRNAEYAAETPITPITSAIDGAIDRIRGS